MTAQSLLMVFVLSGSSPACSTCDTPAALNVDGTKIAPVEMTAAETTERLRSSVENGTLLFTQGNCLAVKIFTNSPYTHVGAVVIEKDKPVVYDSTSGVGVRKLSFEDYVEKQSECTMYVTHPKKAFSKGQTEIFTQNLENQIGRPYGIRHHLTGKRAEGLHCSEYVTDALMSIKLIEAEKPSRVSPASLHTGVTKHGIYTAGQAITILPQPKPRPIPESWCGRMWQETVDCTSYSCRKLSGWILCR